MNYPRTTIIEKDPDWVKLLLNLAARNIKLLSQGKRADVDELGYTTVYGLAAFLEQLADQVKEYDEPIDLGAENPNRS